MTGFTQVKAILDRIKRNRDWDRVLQIHSAEGSHREHPLDWESKAQLQAAEVWRFEGDDQAIKYKLIDVTGGKTAEDTYLITALRRSFKKQVDLGAYPRMPNRGPYLSDEQIKAIADWIDAGMPD